MNSTTASTIAVVLIPSVPLVLLYLIGIIMALNNASRYRKPSTLALTGFVGLLLGALVRAGSMVMTLPDYRGNLSIQELGTRMAVIGFLASLFTLAGTILVLLAIFSGREQRQP